MIENNVQFKNDYAISPFVPLKQGGVHMEFSLIKPGGDIPSGCLHSDKLAKQASSLIGQLGRRPYV